MTTEEMPPPPDFLSQEVWEHIWSTRSVEGQREFARVELETYLKTKGDTVSGFGDDLAFAFGGQPGMKMADNHLLLTTIGRKSGQKRTTPLIFLSGEQDTDLVVIGSFAGLPNNPAWYLNLVANPEATVQIANERWTVVARVTEGEERARLWEKVEKYFKLWAYFQKFVDRQFPVVVLSQKGPKEPAEQIS
jgi:deazaflavin-dependent oxidoreductase (nitroreductase family)